ncbi:E3 ubiquitin-protein ligase RMA1H1-like isoform X1 [Rhodamnia argentea]|uniref:E3 ubiquitin-protein ligase RMA n=2 Tax=Rhodamnia argentea TaxID=178133 RepID=A0A8B8QBA8_9MYRT|nr:E3 ubiquitin-protein ligase RMA1H1-like isoform X1 [Rhodamnia argentea]XP_048132463.1 E3 ubiquitin-protein ligase RMA1H1-like isoform X1 [Rhodamnia argentea]
MKRFLHRGYRLLLSLNKICSKRSMVLEQYFAKEWKSTLGNSETIDPGNSIGSFDCNICLESAQEPVITLCGHLYCWPCIYKWLHVQSASLASDEHPQCPVCKSEISHTAMVPLYGRGHCSSELELEGKSSNRAVVIPPRPAACGTQAPASTAAPTTQQLPYRNPYQDQHFHTGPLSSYENEASSSLLNFGSTGIRNTTVGMFGEMVYARVFGNSLSLYGYPHSYHLVGGHSPRLRRQEMQADKSLNRVSVFLFCWCLLCLIVF